jgi:hypothetical protein
MKVLAFVGLSLIALTAHGDMQLDLTQPQTNALTTIDETPPAAVLDPAFVPSGVGTAQNLQNIALADATQMPPIPFGVQLNAIRSLPMYCPSGDPRPPCGNSNPALDTIAHSTLVQLIKNYTLLMAPTALDLLRLRAAIEALGIAGFSAGLPDDVASLVGFLDHASRDVRTTTAKALGNLCNTQAIVPLRTRLQAEHIAQVNLAISSALRDLGQCPGN